MTPPTVLEAQRDARGALTRLTVRKQRQEDRLEIGIAEVLADIEHELDTLVSLEKEGLERELQELLAGAPQWCGEGFRLIRREWPTDIGPVDLMCRDVADEWVAVEIKRIATIDAVEQLTRYLERIRRDPALGACRGVLAAQRIKPQARVLAQARGIECVEVDLDVLRGEREPELKLFAA
jgi:RecB family endonuclease NucS